MIDLLTQINVVVEEPITTNRRKTIYGNAILLSNAGDDDVMINRGFTLAAGKSMPLKTGDDANIIVWDMSFVFAGVGVNPRIEIITSSPEGAQYDNYNPE